MRDGFGSSRGEVLEGDNGARSPFLARPSALLWLYALSRAEASPVVQNHASPPPPRLTDPWGGRREEDEKEKEEEEKAFK